MKGIILAGGAGTRLKPLTLVTSKQLLPIYHQPMIYYPLHTLIKAGITEILLVIAPENAGDFVKLLGQGQNFGVKFTYAIQTEPKGIAEAFIIGANFIGSDEVALVLGDNIFDDDFTNDIKNFTSGAKIFVKEVPDPHRFGVVELDQNHKVLSIEEKPLNPKSNFAQTGLYLCDNSVIAKSKQILPSARGELEITDVMNLYLQTGSLLASFVKKPWFDAGTHESMFEASAYVRDKIKSND